MNVIENKSFFSGVFKSFVLTYLDQQKNPECCLGSMDRKSIATNSKLCNPRALQANSIQLTHQGHQGMSKKDYDELQDGLVLLHYHYSHRGQCVLKQIPVQD